MVAADPGSTCSAGGVSGRHVHVQELCPRVAHRLVNRPVHQYGVDNVPKRPGGPRCASPTWPIFARGMLRARTLDRSFVVRARHSVVCRRAPPEQSRLLARDVTTAHGRAVRFRVRRRRCLQAPACPPSSAVSFADRAAAPSRRASPPARRAVLAYANAFEQPRTSSSTARRCSSDGVGVQMGLGLRALAPFSSQGVDGMRVVTVRLRSQPVRGPGMLRLRDQAIPARRRRLTAWGPGGGRRGLRSARW